MSPRYLLRFDDVCPTMNWKRWKEIEEVLCRLEISPILAVIPDNQDRTLMAAAAIDGFWSEVRKWQARGWTIGLHGYQHLYVTREAGIVGIAKKSEFAGLSEQEQEDKLQRAIGIFRNEGVTPEVWVAPSHSFDRATIAVLKRIGIRTISDGLAVSPHVDADGMLWIPQQLWKFRRRPFGVWTVCFHLNSWTTEDMDRFRDDVRQYGPAITDMPAVVNSCKQNGNRALDAIYAAAHSTALSIRRQMRPSS